jgi:predicted RNA-binding protein with PIN domain
MGSGARRVSARELVREIAEGEADLADRSSSGSSRSLLEDRIDPRTREALFRWARGA